MNTIFLEENKALWRPNSSRANGECKIPAFCFSLMLGWLVFIIF